MATENVRLAFADDAIDEIARIAAAVNERTENIGARRLHTVLEKLLEELSFDAPELGAREVTIAGADVRAKLEAILGDEDLSRYILAIRGPSVTVTAPLPSASAQASSTTDAVGADVGGDNAAADPARPTSTITPTDSDRSPSRGHPTLAHRAPPVSALARTPRAESMAIRPSTYSHPA